MQILSSADRGTIAGMCANWSLFVRTWGQLAKMREAGSIMEARRLASVCSDVWRNYQNAAKEMGLTPASRSRVQVDKDAKPRDEFEDFLKRGSA